MLFNRGSSVRVWCMVTVSILGVMEWCTRSVPISYSSFVLSLVPAHVGRRQEIAQQWDPIMIWDTADYQLFKNICSNNEKSIKFINFLKHIQRTTMKNKKKYMKKVKKINLKIRNDINSFDHHVGYISSRVLSDVLQMYMTCIYSYKYWKYFLLLNDIFLL